ncbi:hypothetical protein N9760_07240 [Schleiferiaceae bacterium]|nr:hypothetical protein [Schleiferiaceae bacterium]
MKVLILDDHEAIREIVKKYTLKVLPSADFTECANIEEAKEALSRPVKIDYVICDLELKAGCSIEFPDLCRHEKIPFMVYSSHVNKELINELEYRRVSVYVSKISKITHLQQGLENFYNGRKYYCPLVQKTKDSKEKFKELTRLDLTPGQRKAMNVLAKGFNRKEAADILGIERTTLNNIIHRAREANDCEDFPEILRRFQFWEH